MPNSFNIHPDDSAYIIIEIERIFNVEISDEEAEVTHNFGDLNHLLFSKLETKAHGKKCASQMAFYNLRSFFAQISPHVKLTPSTKISSLSETPYALFKRLKNKTSLNYISPSLKTYVGFSLISLSIASLIFGHMFLQQSIVFGAALAVIGLLLVKLDKGILPESSLTLGDIANDLVAQHYGVLIKRGAALRPEEFRSILIKCLSSWPDLPPHPDAIRDDTGLIL